MYTGVRAGIRATTNSNATKTLPRHHLTKSWAFAPQATLEYELYEESLSLSRLPLLAAPPSKKPPRRFYQV